MFAKIRWLLRWTDGVGGWGITIKVSSLGKSFHVGRGPGLAGGYGGLPDGSRSSMRDMRGGRESFLEGGMHPCAWGSLIVLVW
jgi:hypothetical protein